MCRTHLPNCRNLDGIAVALFPNGNLDNKKEDARPPASPRIVGTSPAISATSASEAPGSSTIVVDCLSPVISNASYTKAFAFSSHRNLTGPPNSLVNSRSKATN